MNTIPELMGHFRCLPFPNCVHSLCKTHRLFSTSPEPLSGPCHCLPLGLQCNKPQMLVLARWWSLWEVPPCILCRLCPTTDHAGRDACWLAAISFRPHSRSVLLSSLAGWGTLFQTIQNVNYYMCSDCLHIILIGNLKLKMKDLFSTVHNGLLARSQSGHQLREAMNGVKYYSAIWHWQSDLFIFDGFDFFYLNCHIQKFALFIEYVS